MSDSSHRGDGDVEQRPRFVAIADHALLVEFASEIGDAASDSVLALDRALAATTIDGVIEVVPAFVNVLIDFDPVVTDHQHVETAVRSLLDAIDVIDASPTTHRISVCYDLDLAPDLEAVATASGLSVDAVVASHVGGNYRVAMYGFAPGCAYLAGVPSAIQIQRKPAPVRGLAAGSVIIAGPQCLVTTIEMPTGWWRIGRSPDRIMHDDDEHPFLFDVGDRVVFERVDLATFERLTMGT